MKATVAMALVVMVSGLVRAQGAAEQLPAGHPDAVRVAQETAAKVSAERAQQRDAAFVPLTVEVVVSKYQSDKRISSLPFQVTLATDSVRAGVRMGSKVAVPASTINAPGAPFSYQDVGTNIDAGARSLDSGRFSLTITIEDSSLTTPEQTSSTAVSTIPALRTYRSTNTLIMRDGQTMQFTAASDKVTGEVIKADVTLKVVK